MATRLYIGNLPFSIGEDQLRKIFEGSGREVADTKVITDRQTGRSRGFGFVEFTNDSEAQAAIKELNGLEISGRAIVVNEARPRSTRDSGPGGGGMGGDRPRRDSRPPRY